jgi:hypothetical protein
MNESAGPESGPTPASAEIARLLAEAPAYLQTLPAQERRIASLAAGGAPVWAIAQEIRISDAAVARTLDGIVAALTGRELHPVETGGLGADTDPGVTGGYGDTGFGSLDTEPMPDNTEPDEAGAPKSWSDDSAS